VVDEHRRAIDDARRREKVFIADWWCISLPSLSFVVLCRLLPLQRMLLETTPSKRNAK
jgi:hypothetical protein